MHSVHQDKQLKWRRSHSEIDTQSIIFISEPFYSRFCLHFSDTYKAKHIIWQRACQKKNKGFHSGLTTQRKIREGIKTLLFLFGLTVLRILMTNTLDKKEINLTNSFQSVMLTTRFLSFLMTTWHWLRSLRGQFLPGVSVSDLHLLLRDVSDLFMSFFLMSFCSELIQVVIGFCVIAQFHWREILNQLWPSGRALKQAGRRVGAGYRIQALSCWLRHSYIHSVNCCLATEAKLTLVLD